MYDGCKVYFFFRLDVDPAILKDLYSWQMAVWVVVVLDQGCEARRMSSPEDGYLLILWLSYVLADNILVLVVLNPTVARINIQA